MSFLALNYNFQYKWKVPIVCRHHHQQQQALKYSRPPIWFWLSPWTVEFCDPAGSSPTGWIHPLLFIAPPFKRVPLMKAKSLKFFKKVMWSISGSKITFFNKLSTKFFSIKSGAHSSKQTRLTSGEPRSTPAVLLATVIRRPTIRGLLDKA